MIIIPDEKTRKPSISVNKRTGTVSKIEKSDCKDIIKTTSVGTKSLYSVPIEVANHLRFDNDDGENDAQSIRHKNFHTIQDLEKFLMFPRDKPVKLSLFWNASTA